MEQNYVTVNLCIGSMLRDAMTVLTAYGEGGCDGCRYYDDDDNNGNQNSRAASHSTSGSCC